ncbi:MAG: tRNA (adenosine(37)-N6)-dimethylallyltransferase MiaA [Bacilli bacterium]|nr:tRNA (adenosine(37)-N6)-dimethylallyltransferase MiaA [Bacilli bacterium]
MPKIIVITGPTGVGKTKLSIALAKTLNGEIINADSMQIYKGLDIGTAKIKDNEKENIAHHLFDIKGVTEDYSVYNYQQDGRMKITELLNKNKTPIIIGGTGLYIKALLYDYNFNKEKNINTFETYSTTELYKMLIEKEPSTNIHKNNRKRIIRRLNMINNNSFNNKSGNKLLYDVIFIGLTLPREILYDRINKRVDLMIETGLINEVKSFYDKDIRSKAINTGIGYKELYDYFDNKITLEEAIDLIKRNSRRYAKRQYTWFNNQMEINWFNVNLNNFNDTIEEILKYIKQKSTQ